MAEPSESIPKLTPEQRQMVAKLATRAKQVLATGNLDYAITLYLDCCKRDPANVPWRQELRKTEKLKYKDNKKGKALAFLSTWRPGLKMETFSKTGNHLKAIEFAEEVLRSNPWHLRALIVSAHAFDALGLKDLALWSFDQARQIEANNPTINRQMALLFEERGQFPQAIQLWKTVAAKLPKDKGNYDNGVPCKLTGEWLVTEMYWQGVKQPPEKAKAEMIVITEKEIIFVDLSVQAKANFELTINEKVMPHELDLKLRNVVLRAIYKLDGNKLVMAIGGNQRPTSFMPKEMDGCKIMTLVRKKP